MLLSIQQNKLCSWDKDICSIGVWWALLLGPSTPGSPAAWSPAPRCEKVGPASCAVCVCFPPEAVLNLAPPVAYFVYSVLLSWPSSRWLIAAAEEGHGQGWWTRGVRGGDSPSCLLIAQSASFSLWSSRLDLMACIPIPVGVCEC